LLWCGVIGGVSAILIQEEKEELKCGDNLGVKCGDNLEEFKLTCQI
jgi:hypothetical protein